MTDLDYDALDAAVNAASDDKPAPATDTKPSPAVQRGRFMDMVHPSSDMKSSGPLPNRAPEVPVVPAVDQEEPDTKNETETDITAVFTKNPETSSDSAINDTNDQTPLGEDAKDESDYTSPFLENASDKVKDEKRPLGVESSYEPGAEQESIKAISEDALAMEAEPAIALEESDVEPAAEEDTYVANDPPVEPPVASNPDDGPAEMITPIHEPPAAEPVADKTPTSPYEAAAYEHDQAPKRRIWLWVLMAVVLVVVGAAAGVALYMMDLL